MRTKRTFRPLVGDALETRAVPTTTTAGLAAIPGLDSKQVVAEFGTFEESYQAAAQRDLFSTGTAPTDQQRATFNSDVASALTTLNSSIDRDIANLPQAAGLGAAIQAELIGGTSGTLQSALLGIPTPSSGTFGTERAFLRKSFSDANQASAIVARQVRKSPHPLPAVSQTTLQNDLNSVSAGFRTLQRNYNNDIKVDLIPAGGTGNPAINRPSFNSDVQDNLTKLDQAINTAVNNLPLPLKASVETIVQNDLLINGSTSDSSLQARLAAIPTPDGATAFKTYLFKTDSTFVINAMEGQVENDIAVATGQYNLTVMTA